MPRPTRELEALEVLTTYYREQGVLPTVEVFASLMGYRSTSSAFKVLQLLIANGAIAKDARGGRLLPGKAFRGGNDSKKLVFEDSSGLPPEFAALLQEVGKDAVAVQVTDDSLAGQGILAGDFLMVSPKRAGQGRPRLVETASGALDIVTTRAPRGGKALGYLVAQFRRYRH